MGESKKDYAPPTLTVHGDVVEITKGLIGGTHTDVPIGTPGLFVFS